MYQDFILHCLQETSSLAMKNFGKVKSMSKTEDNNQVLTQTDLQIGNLLVTKIKKQFPKHNVIDEETGVIDKKSPLTWSVDPIDGTSNFSGGLPMFGIMLGLLENNTPMAGGVALPYFQEIYFAEKEKGAFCNRQKIKVSKETNLLNCLVVYAIDGHQEKPELTYKEAKVMADIILNIRNLRTSNSCFDLMMVAKGKYGGWLNRTSRIYDNVAPQIIIEEAGGLYTDFFGNKIDYSNPVTKIDQNFTTCTAPPQLHQKLQKIIKNHKFEN